MPRDENGHVVWARLVSGEKAALVPAVARARPADMVFYAAHQVVRVMPFGHVAHLAALQNGNRKPLLLQKGTVLCHFGNRFRAALLRLFACIRSMMFRFCTQVTGEILHGKRRSFLWPQHGKRAYAVCPRHTSRRLVSTAPKIASVQTGTSTMRKFAAQRRVLRETSRIRILSPPACCACSERGCEMACFLW